MTNYNLFPFNKDKAFIYSETRGKIGNRICINTKGEKIFELISNTKLCYDFEGENVAIVQICPEVGNSKSALINEKGEYLTEFIYDDIYGGSEEGFFEVRKDGKHGHIDLNGKEIVPCIYDDGSYFSEGVAPEQLGNKWGVIDFRNAPVIPFNYDFIGICKNNTMYAIQGKGGLIDKFNNVVIGFKYDYIDGFYNRDEVVTCAKLNDYWGFIDKSGVVIEKFKYSNIESNSDNGGFYVVDKEIKSKTKKALYSSTTCKFLTDFLYDEISWVTSDRCRVKVGDKYGYIDILGNSITEIIYEKAEEFFDEGLVSVSLNGQYGMIDIYGNTVIPHEYKRLYRSSEGLIRAINKNDKDGIIDRSNNIVIPFGYFDIESDFSCGYAVAYSKLAKNCYIDNGGKILKLKGIK